MNILSTPEFLNECLKTAHVLWLGFAGFVVVNNLGYVADWLHSSDKPKTGKIVTNRPAVRYSTPKDDCLLGSLDQRETWGKMYLTNWTGKRVKA